MGLLQRYLLQGVNIPELLAAEGRVFTASFGSETAPLTAVAYNQDQPEIGISVANGTSIIPLRVEIMLESFAGTDNEIIISRLSVEAGAGTSTAASSGPTPWGTGTSLSSNATARHLYTANLTLTGYEELWRSGQPLADTNPGSFVWEPRPTPHLRGPSSLLVQIAGTTTQPTFYGKAMWAEIPENWY